MAADVLIGSPREDVLTNAPHLSGDNRDMDLQGIYRVHRPSSRSDQSHTTPLIPRISCTSESEVTDGIGTVFHSHRNRRTEVTRNLVQNVRPSHTEAL